MFIDTCKIKHESKVIHSIENGTTWCNYTIENVGKKQEGNWSCELVRKSYVATKIVKGNYFPLIFLLFCKCSRETPLLMGIMG